MKYTKKIYLFIALILCCNALFAQLTSKKTIDIVTEDTTPKYIKDPHIPSFNFMQLDSSRYTNEMLPTNTNIIVIWYSPDCSHCKFEAVELKKKIDSLSNITFIWATYHQPEEIKKFIAINKLAGIKNMLFVRDEKYFLPSFYQIKFTPFMALYNSNGMFVKAFRNGALPYEIIEATK